VRLNIKNPETYRLVEELAKRTSESMTAAVTIAVRERLDRIRSEQRTGLAALAHLLAEDTTRPPKLASSSSPRSNATPTRKPQSPQAGLLPANSSE
jgi:antitoxin VapB